MTEHRAQVWSCGGGNQSAGIAALIASGKLPKPDFSIIVDTEREKSSTWDYVNSVLIPRLASVGVTLERVTKSRYATVDLFDHKGKHLIPYFTTINGKVGKTQSFCSNEWKKRVTMRWLKDIGVAKCDNWIGISTDEIGRVKFSGVQWLRNKYPLVELGLSRADCIQLVKDMGWPAPPRSACWMCPQMSDVEWLEMKTNLPEDFARAIEFESYHRIKDPFFYLHISGVPISEVEFQLGKTAGKDDSCASGYCYV